MPYTPRVSTAIATNVQDEHGRLGVHWRGDQGDFLSLQRPSYTVRFLLSQVQMTGCTYHLALSRCVS